MHKNKDIRILLRYNFEKSGEKMLPSSRSRQQLKVTSHLQRPKKSFLFLFGKIEVSHFI